VNCYLHKKLKKYHILRVIFEIILVKEEEEEEEENGQLSVNVIEQDFEMETGQISETEPEKEEPRRVSFQDFMRQLSSTSAAPIAIPSPIPESPQEMVESSSIISNSLIEESSTMVKQSPEEVEVVPVAAPKKVLPARISLNSDAIRALANSLPQLSAPVIMKTEVASPKDPRVFDQSQTFESVSSSLQNFEPPISAPVIERTVVEIIPPRSAPLELSQPLETSRPLSRTSDDFKGPSELPRAPSYERVWKEERSHRERRESDPSYPLHNRDREFDTPMERSYSIRESFPPPMNRGPREYRNQTWSDPRANDAMLEESLGAIPRARMNREPLNRDLQREFPREMQRDRDLLPRDGPQGYPRREYYQPAMRGRGRGYEGRGGFYRGGPPDGHGPPFDRYPPPRDGMLPREAPYPRREDGMLPREGPPYPRREYHPHQMRGRGRRGR
jgi:hypothetical protein